MSALCEMDLSPGTRTVPENGARGRAITALVGWFMASSPAPGIESLRLIVNPDNIGRNLPFDRSGLSLYPACRLE